MTSIIQHTKECFKCKTTSELQDHHIFYGTANRKISEREGLKVYLCRKHHEQVHMNCIESQKLKRIAQRKFEETHTREEFRKLIGKSYL